MDEDEKFEMRGNQHRTKPSFGIRATAQQRGFIRRRVTAEDGWGGHGRGYNMATGQWA